MHPDEERKGNDDRTLLKPGYGHFTQLKLGYYTHVPCQRVVCVAKFYTVFPGFLPLGEKMTKIYRSKHRVVRA